MNTKPKYYKSGDFDVIDAVKKFDLNFNLGNVLKYIVRAGRKDSETHIDDLEKALEYLEREIEYLERVDMAKEDLIDLAVRYPCFSPEDLNLKYHYNWDGTSTDIEQNKND